MASRRCSNCNINYGLDVRECLACGTPTWLLNEEDPDVPDNMIDDFGFFTWDYDKIRHLREVQGAGQQHRIDCPNCGTTCTLGNFENHRCQRQHVEEHHTLLFRCEFHISYSTRNAWDRTPSKGKSFGKYEPSGLYVWDDFEMWLKTPQGQFAQYQARESR